MFGTTYEIQNDSEQGSEVNLFDKEFSKFKEKLEQQIAQASVILEENDDKYVKSVYVDGHNVVFILVNDEKVEGPLNSLTLGIKKLEHLGIRDQQVTGGILGNRGLSFVKIRPRSRSCNKRTIRK